jgi:diadenosine tetraphosphate (Ap4A) HIT family hydrolase
VICRGPEGDEELLRVQVWEDELWRLTTSVSGDPVPGFSYLEPKRHIPSITELDGDEALTFGAVMARVTGALKEGTGAEVVTGMYSERASRISTSISRLTEQETA